MSHTPGPWQVGRLNADFAEEVFAGEPSMTTGIASVWTLRGGVIPLSEIQANARLIAVAPDFYVAAKALVDEISREYFGIPEPQEDDDDQYDPLITMRYIRQLRDAIAKAEGR